MLYADYVATLFDFGGDYSFVNAKGYDAFRAKVNEPDDPATAPVKGTRHQSTRGERRKLTAHHKSREKRLKSSLDYKVGYVNDPAFHHDHTERVWFSGRVETSHKKEVRVKKEVEQFWKTVPDYPELTDQVWNQAWSEYEEEKYWDRVDLQEWEDMKTFQEIEEFYREEEEHRSGLARDLSSARDGLARDTDSGIEPEDDADISPVGVVTDHYVLERGVTCQGMRFICEDEEAARWLFHRLSAFYPSSTDFSPKFVRSK